MLLTTIMALVIGLILVFHFYKIRQLSEVLEDQKNSIENLVSYDYLYPWLEKIDEIEDVLVNGYDYREEEQTENLVENESFHKTLINCGKMINITDDANISSVGVSLKTIFLDQPDHILEECKIEKEAEEIPE